MFACSVEKYIKCFYICDHQRELFSKAFYNKVIIMLGFVVFSCLLAASLSNPTVTDCGTYNVTDTKYTQNKFTT